MMSRPTTARLCLATAVSLIGCAAAAAPISAADRPNDRPSDRSTVGDRPTSPVPGVRVGATAPREARQGCGHGNCIHPSTRAAVQAAIERNRAALAGSFAEFAGRAVPQSSSMDSPDWLYRFFPMAGTLGVDTFNALLVDLDPSSPGFHDYACRPFTYDGHGGIDAEIRSFAEQFIGVPIFAARDGVVVFAQDGWPDTNVAGGTQGNIVIIDHGDGYQSEYYHLKKDSVAVTLGQIVVAGQQIGMVGSSGNSFGPHLHFGTVDTAGGGYTAIEPFAGPCRDGASRWLDQLPLDDDALRVHDFAITRTPLDSLPQPWWEPWPLPTDGQVQVDDTDVIFWWRVYNFPENAPIRVRFWRPDGSLAWDAQWSWGNPETYRTMKTWFAFPLAWMKPVVGSWRLRFEINGAEVMDTPFEVVATVDPNFNRPPNPIGLAFAPLEPTADDPLFCRVVTDPAKEDPDWDVVRYRYEWRVNGALVRDVTTAAQSDAIPRGTASPGDVVAVKVTPSDGTIAGQASTATITIAGGLPGDLDGNGVINGADLAALLSAWGTCGGCPADLNGDGAVGGADLVVLLAGWGA